MSPTPALPARGALSEQQRQEGLQRDPHGHPLGHIPIPQYNVCEQQLKVRPLGGGADYAVELQRIEEQIAQPVAEDEQALKALAQ